MRCEVCNKELSMGEIFCPNCGFEHHILPNDLNPQVQKYENDRKENYKKKYDELNKTKQTNGRLEEQIEGLETIKGEKAELAEQLRAADKDIESLTEKLNKLKTVESRNAELAEQLEVVSKDKGSLTKELNNKLEKVEGEKNELAERLRAADKIIEELKGKISTTPPVTTQPVAYIIYGHTSKQYVLPIYDNKVNYYATPNAKDIVIKNNSVSEDEILKIPRVSLSDVKIAFKIEKSNNSENLYLKDLVGNLTFPLSNPSEKSYRLSNNSIFYVEVDGTKFTGKYSRL